MALPSHASLAERECPSLRSHKPFEPNAQVFQLGVLDDDLAATVVVLDGHFESQGALQAVLHLADIGIDDRLRLGFLFRLVRIEQALNHAFGLPDGEGQGDDALGGLFNLGGVAQSQEGAGMAEAELIGLHPGLHGGGKLEQAQEVGHRDTVFAGALRHLLLGHLELAGEALEGAGLFHGIEVGALQVLDDGDLHRLLIGDLAQDGRNGGFARQLGGSPAALPGNELEAAVVLGPDQDGLHHPVGGDGGGKLLQLLVIDVGAGLERVAIDLVDGDLARFAAGLLLGGSRGCRG